MESAIQKEIMDYLLAFPNVKVWRINSGYVRRNVKLAPDGIGDIEGFVRTGRHSGKYINFEVKTAMGKQRCSQRRWQIDMEAAGCHYFLVRNVGDVKAICEQYYVT